MTHINPQGRRVRSPEVWAAAREAYLEGESAQDVCLFFDLGLSALRARARREGWRRKDQPDVAPPDLAEDIDEELEADGPADFARMADRAARLAQRALGDSDLRRAEGFIRLYRRLESATEAARLRSAERAERAAWAARKAASPGSPPPADVHSVHSVHYETKSARPAPASAPPPRPPNRAARRRLAKLRGAEPPTPRSATGETFEANLVPSRPWSPKGEVWQPARHASPEGVESLGMVMKAVEVGSAGAAHSRAPAILVIGATLAALGGSVSSVSAATNAAASVSGPPIINPAFKARMPRKCNAVKHLPSEAEAAALVQCATENGGEAGAFRPMIYLWQNVRVQMGGSRPYIYNADSHSTGIDTTAKVYPIRVTGDQLSCTGKATCMTRHADNSEGTCYKTTFGDWKCYFSQVFGVTASPVELAAPTTY